MDDAVLLKPTLPQCPEVRIGEEHEKTRGCHINHPWAASHTGSLMIEIIKTMVAGEAGTATVGEKDRMPTNVLVDRARAITQETVRVLEQEGWIVRMPTLDELLHNDTQAPGFHQPR